LADPDGTRTPRHRVPRRLPTPDAIDVLVGGPLTPADVPALWRRARSLAEICGADVIVCDVAELLDPDAVTVDALARLQLAARRSGRRIRLRNACHDLCDLLRLMGLSEALPTTGGSVLQPGGQAEQREPPRRVQEEADPSDPIA
jgi:ABC-type transporter Mla MlaB component